MDAPSTRSSILTTKVAHQTERRMKGENVKETLKSLGKIQEPGFKKMDATSVFRAVNFELYAKPNKFMMAFGILAFSGCVAFIAYLNVQEENKKTYAAIKENGEFELRKKQSKWD